MVDRALEKDVPFDVEHEQPRRDVAIRSCFRMMIQWPLRVIISWSRNLAEHINGPTGYTVIGAILGAYFGLYAVMEASHERQLNRAAFERSAFTDLVTSTDF